MKGLGSEAEEMMALVTRSITLFHKFSRLLFPASGTWGSPGLPFYLRPGQNPHPAAASVAITS